MKKLKMILGSLCVGLLSSSALAVDVSGKYSCEGFDPFENENYTAEVFIERTGETYTIKAWDNNGVPHLGTGIFHPERPDEISVVCVDQSKVDTNVYVAMYRVQASKESIVLNGIWSMQGKGAVASEICTRQETLNLRIEEVQSHVPKLEL